MPKLETPTLPRAAARRVDAEPADLLRERREAVAKYQADNREWLRSNKMSPAMRRLEHITQTPDYLTATTKMKSRIAGAPAPELTSAEQRALDSARRDYNVAKTTEPRRADRRYDGLPVTPSGVRTGNRKYLTELAIRIAQLPEDERPHVAANARSNIFADRTHPYWLPDHPDHPTAVIEMQELTKMEMKLNEE